MIARSQEMEATLAHYKALVHRYHHAMDLMSASALKNIDIKIEEGLAFAKAIQNQSRPIQSLIDVGSGVGLPAIPLAIVLPDVYIRCFERRTKRARFLTLVVSQLGLKNIHIEAGDVRDAGDFEADIVTALAVGSFSYLFSVTRHLHASPVTLISKKGDSWEDEILLLKKQFHISLQVETFHVKHGTLVALTV